MKTSTRTSALLALAATAGVSTLAGCAIGTSAPATPLTTPGVTLHGIAHGGQQPISGATIGFYQVGTTGYGTGAISLLTKSVTTDSNGSFSITGAWTCTPSALVYIVSSGGNPGAGTNSASALLTALGKCDNLNASSYITINELTTVAAAYALAPFMNGTTIGAPTTNQVGLSAAFDDAAQLVNTQTGAAPGSLPTGATIPVALLNSLANILAACVNSIGPASQPCSMLFQYTTPSGGQAPTSTISAAINMARNPTANTQSLLNLNGATSPFAPTVASAADFTVGITYPVGRNPVSLAVDANNSAWVVNNTDSSLSVIASTGATVTYSPSSVQTPEVIAFDATGNAWVANAAGTLSIVSSTGATLPGSPHVTSWFQPNGIAIDPFGKAWVSCACSSYIQEVDSNGNLLTTPSGTTDGKPGLTAVAINSR